MIQESEGEALAYLIGALADGSLYRSEKHYVHRITYFQHSKDYLLRCIEPRIERLFNVKGHFYLDKRKGVWFYEITRKKVYLRYLGCIESFKSDGDRKVPSWIKNGSKPIQFSFISGFFDADGFYHIDTKRSDYRVRFGQAEYYILEDMRDMLQSHFKCSEVLGPYQSKPNVKPYYELQLYGIAQVRKFKKVVRPCHPDKQLENIL